MINIKESQDSIVQEYKITVTQSVHIKSGSPTNGEEDSHSKDNSKPWKAPLRFLGHLVDSRFRRKLWGSAKRTKSVDHILQDKKDSSDTESKECNGFDITEDAYSSSESSSSESNDEDEMEEIEEWRPKKCTWKAPVARKISNNQKAQVDPALLAEIEEFEKMAAQYIKQHS
ncbi:uncharacterized protein CDAR_218661 [Caerostris darwini]|uniref:Uncharacterized protein n=1 Tax=Caerostris darwini TaxID=1538125 RepID=A0AAV4UGR6_9ARAC|nr:uncharacterized protein CDAR_218661 [Caerostris darwini]